MKKWDSDGSFSAKNQWALKSALSSYAKAQQHYATLRDKFISQLYPLQQQVGSELWKKVADNINDNLKNITADEIFTKEQQALLESRMRAIANQLLNSRQGQSIKSQIAAASSRQKQYSSSVKGQQAQRHNLINTLKPILNNYIRNDVNILNTLYACYENAFSLVSMRGEATTNALYGYLRREMVSQVLRQRYENDYINSISTYINNFRGDTGELIGTEAINQAYPDTAAQVGTISGNSGHYSAYDIVVGPGAATKDSNFLQQVINNLEMLDRNITLNLETINYNDYVYMGGQSKSWYPPGIDAPKNANTSYLDIGSRKEIYDKYQFGAQPDMMRWNRGWHYSAHILGQEILRVLGSGNVFYKVGGANFIWTTDLIDMFKKSKYYLTFYYNHPSGEYIYPGTPTVVWAQQKIKLGRRIRK